VNGIDLDFELIWYWVLIFVIDSTNRNLAFGLSKLYTLLVLLLLPLGLLNLLLYSLQLVVDHPHPPGTVALTLFSIMHQSDRQKTVLLAISARWILA
jgi:hypothetical protein